MLAFMALEFGGDPKQGAVYRGAIISGQLDNACFDDETAKFDELPGTLATVNLPGAHIIPSPCRLPAIVGCPVALERREGCAEIP
ncbi:hypothetical protein X735_11520 [Mesorhizobium sp. L2C085B000]|nr:hypothetical protein X735_11520 [Mesorhizobium sp. L2C085B000]